MADNQGDAPEVPAALLVGVAVVHQCLEVCCLTQQQKGAVMMEGFQDLRAFGHCTNKDLSEMVKHIGALPAARGGVRIGQNMLKNMEALVLWIADMICHNQDTFFVEKRQNESRVKLRRNK